MSIHNRTNEISRHFFFMRDVANLSAPSSIKQAQLNGNASHPIVLSELLIEDEEPDLMVMPKFCLFICMFFDEKCILGCFERSNCSEILILEFINFFIF